MNIKVLFMLTKKDKYLKGMALDVLGEYPEHPHNSNLVLVPEIYAAFTVCFRLFSDFNVFIDLRSSYHIHVRKILSTYLLNRKTMRGTPYFI